MQGLTAPIPLEFHVAGYIVEGSLDDNFIFRHDYFQDSVEQRGMKNFMGNIFAIYVEPNAGVSPAALAEKIDAQFAGGPVFTKTESEAAVLATFAASAKLMVVIILLFGVAASLTLFLIVANAISMSIRERALEIGVLKTLGMTQFAPINFALGVISRFVVSGPIAIAAVILAVTIGAGSSLWPAWRAARMSIVDILRRLN
jgi:ABC-type antimicrobial peptide transport system permease subunit